MSMLRRIRLVAALACIALGLLCGACSNEVKIGAVISETGSLASYGERVKKSLDLAADEINAAGGVNGGKVTLIYEDDATNAERGKSVTEKLIDEDGVHVIIGAISSRVTLAIAPICEERRVVLLSPAASTPALTDAGEYIFRNYPSDVLEGTAMAKFAKDLGLERLVVFALDDDWGKGLEQVFTEQYVGTSKFRAVVRAFHWTDGDTSRFAEMARQTAELAPDGIYIASYVNDLGRLLVELHDAGVHAVTMGNSSVTPDELLHAAGDAAQHLVYPQPIFDVNSSDPAVASFVSAYRKRYGEDPDIYAAHGYDALKILAKAIEIGGSMHPDNIRNGLIGVKAYEGAAGRTDFDLNGDVVRYPRILIIQDGAVEPYETFVEQGGSLLTES